LASKNTLAYPKGASLEKKKVFNIDVSLPVCRGPSGVYVKKNFFTSAMTTSQNKLEHLNLASLANLGVRPGASHNSGAP
jgi:hypothetical protein